MAYKHKTLLALIADIQANKLVLPRIQRSFVWETEQVAKLIDSLLRNYPIQAFLFWKTKDDLRARRFQDYATTDAALSKLYLPMRVSGTPDRTFVLDGQQRLQGLYSAFVGGFSDDGKRTNADTAWLDLTSGTEKDTEYEESNDGSRYVVRFEKKSPGPSFYPLRRIVYEDADKSARQIRDEWLAKRREEDGASVENAAQILTTLRNLIRVVRDPRVYWCNELDGIAKPNQYGYSQVLEIFVRVNSGGTQLDASELMFAALKELSSDSEEWIEQVQGQLNSNRSLGFDKTWILRTSSVALGWGPKLERSEFRGPRGKEKNAVFDKERESLLSAFKLLRDFLVNTVRIETPKLIRSHVALMPLVDYLRHNPTPTQSSWEKMVAYFYKAQTLGWFRHSSDSTVESLHAIVGARGEFPLEEVLNHFGSNGVETRFTLDNINKRSSWLLMLHLTLVAKQGRSAFDVLHKNNKPQIDHIYPRRLLRGEGFDFDPVDIDHLGNLSFLEETENKRKSATDPAKYYGEMANKARHVILVEPYATEPARLHRSSRVYRAFRDARLRYILKTIESVVEVKPGKPREVPPKRRKPQKAPPARPKTPPKSPKPPR